MLNIHIDNSGDIFASRTTIADLAQFSFTGCDSDEMNVYQVDAILTRDWRDELADVELENGMATRAKFKDGSEISVGAWSECCRQGDQDYGNCHWCGGAYARKAAHR